MGLCQPENNYQNYCITVKAAQSKDKLSRRYTMNTVGKTNQTVSLDDSTSGDEANAESDIKTSKNLDQKSALLPENFIVPIQECSQRSSPMIGPHNSVRIRYPSEINQSILKRWNTPGYQPGELFIKINYENIFMRK